MKGVENSEDEDKHEDKQQNETEFSEEYRVIFHRGTYCFENKKDYCLIHAYVLHLFIRMADFIRQID